MSTWVGQVSHSGVPESVVSYRGCSVPLKLDIHWFPQVCLILFWWSPGAHEEQRHVCLCQISQNHPAHLQGKWHKANDTVFLLPPTLRLWTPQISRMQNTYQYIFLYPFINLSYCQEQQLHPWTRLDEEKQMQIVHRCLIFLIPGLTHRPLWLILSLFRLYWMQVFTQTIRWDATF